MGDSSLALLFFSAEKQLKNLKEFEDMIQTQVTKLLRLMFLFDRGCILRAD
jgi:hypothetical protein